MMLAKFFRYTLSLSKKLTSKNQFASAKLLLFYMYKFNVETWKMFIIWVLYQCYFATFEQNSFRNIQKLCNFSCMSYYMCKRRRQIHNFY